MRCTYLLVLLVDRLLTTAHRAISRVLDELVDLVLNFTHNRKYAVKLFILVLAKLRQDALGGFRMQESDGHALGTLAGRSSIRRMPLAAASANCSSIFSQASAMWWIPMPLFSMNLAMVDSGDVGSSNSIFVWPSLKNAVRTFWSATSSIA